MKTRVKICGIRRTADARLAIELGARYIGCVLADDSPRCAQLDEARDLAAEIGSRARLVLVFRGNSTQKIVQAVRAVGTRDVQIHGADAALLDDVRHADLNIWNVLRVADEATCLPAPGITPTERCPALVDVGRGGTGRAFRWELLAPNAPDATFVAGGVTPDNVGELLRYKPWGIDVSSGVEAAPGIKDEAKIRRLFARMEKQAEVRS